VKAYLPEGPGGPARPVNPIGPGAPKNKITTHKNVYQINPRHCTVVFSDILKLLI